MTGSLPEHVDDLAEHDDTELPGRIGAIFSEADGDTLSLLERLGRVVGASAIAIVRPRRRSVIAECAWRTDGWQARRVTVHGVTPTALESLTAAEVVQLGVDAAAVPHHDQWDSVWAATDSLAFGLAGSTPRSTEALRIVATIVDVWVTRELSSVTSRMVAVLRERARVGSVVQQLASKECTAIGIRLDLLQDMVDVSPQAHQLVGEIKALSETALANLQASVVDLSPVSPRGAWSVEDLEQFVEDVAVAHSLDVTFAARGRGQLLDSENMELVSAFVQEGLGAVWKHSQTNRGKVHVSFDHGSVSLSISNGELRPTANSSSDDVAGAGHVLRLIRSWAHLLGGEIRSGPVEDGVMALTLDVPL